MENIVHLHMHIFMRVCLAQVLYDMNRSG